MNNLNLGLSKKTRKFRHSLNSNIGIYKRMGRMGSTMNMGSMKNMGSTTLLQTL